MRGLCDFNQLGDPGRLNNFAQHACQDLGGTYQTYLLSRLVLKHTTQGAFVECGVAAGAQLAVMAHAMTATNERRPIHAFDSFKGIPHAGPKDDQQPGMDSFLMDRAAPLEERLVTTKVSGCAIKDVQKLWESWKFKDIEIHWHEGWFQHTLPGISLGPIAFLRLDGDLAESTECCLINLYDSVVPGGIVYVDDYGLEGCKWAVHEFLEARMIMPELFRDEAGNKGAIYWVK